MNALRRICSLLVLLLPCAAMAQGLDGGDQLIVVTSKNWDAIQGTAQRYERHGGSFEKVESAFAVVLGKNGMGWGKGLLDTGLLQGPVKQEGDGKAPAGMFNLGTAFGYDASAQTRLPYLALGPTIECVDDSQSKHYNQLVDNSTLAKDWNSAEHMQRHDDLYRQGIFIEHNTPASAAAGSCIFLHIWRGPAAPTRGCTAMDPADIARLLSWLDPRQSPRLVQLPEAQYRQLRERWHLPEL
jgi:D-alanyl-D-alanine dipeptidase